MSKKRSFPSDYIKPALSFSVAFIFFYFLSIYPFISLKYVPFHDLPEHLAAGTALKDLLFAGPLAANFRFEGFFPNILSWVLIAVLTVFFDILTVSKLLVLLYFLITPLALYYYLDKNKKPLCLLSFIFLNSYGLNMGFVNFVFSVPLIFFSLGAYKKKSQLFYLYTLLLFASHAVSYIFFSVLLLASFFAGRKYLGPVIFSMGLLIIVPFLPSSGQNPVNTAVLSTLSSLNAFLEFAVNIVYYNIFFSASAFKSFRPDYVSLGAFILIACLYIKQLFVDQNYDKIGSYITSFAFFFVLLFPSHLSASNVDWLSYGRFLPVAILFVVTDLRIGNKAQNALILLFLALTFVNSVSLSGAYSEADGRLKAYYEPVIDILPAGGKIFVLEETPWLSGQVYVSKRTYGVSPYRHYFDGYYSLKGGFSSGYFGGGVLNPLQWPVIYVNKTYYAICDYLPFDLVKKGTCIPCSKTDIQCFLDDAIIVKNFDYLLVYNSDGGATNYLVEKPDQPILISTDDVIVYSLRNPPN